MALGTLGVFMTPVAFGVFMTLGSLGVFMTLGTLGVLVVRLSDVIIRARLAIAAEARSPRSRLHQLIAPIN